MSDENLFSDEFLKKLEILYIISRKIASGQMRAERRTKKIGSGIEFADHRNYVPGDDFRNLDWMIYARTRKLLLRLFITVLLTAPHLDARRLQRSRVRECQGIATLPIHLVDLV